MRLFVSPSLPDNNQLVDVLKTIARGSKYLALGAFAPLNHPDTVPRPAPVARIISAWLTLSSKLRLFRRSVIVSISIPQVMFGIMNKFVDSYPNKWFNKSNLFCSGNWICKLKTCEIFTELKTTLSSQKKLSAADQRFMAGKSMASRQKPKLRLSF